MVLCNRVTSSSGLVTHGVVIIYFILCLIFCEINGDERGLSNSYNANGDNLDEISNSPYLLLNPERSSSENNNRSRKFPEEVEGKSRTNSSSGGHSNNSDFIKNGELSTIFCEGCTKQQKDKVEQILYLLYNFNNNAGGNPSTGGQVTMATEQDKNYVLRKQKRKFMATSSPIPGYRKNLPEMIPTPETRVSAPFVGGFIQLPSTTTPATSSPGYSSMAIPIVPYFYSATSSLPLNLRESSTTMSSALEPLQSVEMPTPPMPPTTSGPIYLYYLGGAGATSSSALSSSGSLESPSTPVVESSVAYYSKRTTMEPNL